MIVSLSSRSTYKHKRIIKYYLFIGYESYIETMKDIFVH